MRRLVRSAKTPAPATPAPEIVPASVTHAVRPVLPARFLAAHVRREDAETGFLGLFTVHADGTAEVEIVGSTGKEALDSLALQAARMYRFRPATVAGNPVASYLRIRIQFDTR